MIECHDEDLQRLFSRLLALTTNTRPVMEGIGTTLRTRILQGFEREQSPWGTAWLPLAQSTIDRRRKGKGPGGEKILQNLRHLIGGITFHAEDTSVTVGVAGVPYAPIHQFGGMAGRGHKTRIPARPYLPASGDRVDLPAPWREDITDLIEHHIMRALT